MKCDSLSLPKYIDKSEKIFFIYGDEIVLQNNARDYICNFYKKNGFDEKKIITSKDFPNISQIITQNAGGSLFGSRIIVEIIHEGGKIPKDIMDVLSFKNIDNLTIFSVLVSVFFALLGKLFIPSLTVSEVFILFLFLVKGFIFIFFYTFFLTRKNFSESIWNSKYDSF